MAEVREHDQTSALAAAAERARIARDMHDSVAHHLTVIVALSDGALAAVTRAPAQAADAIQGVSSTAREALAETRRMLCVLRTEGGLELRQPIPGLSDLDGLFTRVRAAGLPVWYERSGPPGDTPPGVQLVIFRLVQQALTNTIKHAGPGAERGRPAAARTGRDTRRSRGRRRRQRRSTPRSRRPDRGWPNASARSAGVRLDHLDEQLHNRTWRVELAAALAPGGSEPAQEVLLHPAEDVLLAVLSCAKADAGDQVDELAEQSYVETGPCVGLRQHHGPELQGAA